MQRKGWGISFTGMEYKYMYRVPYKKNSVVKKLAYIVNLWSFQGSVIECQE